MMEKKNQLSIRFKELFDGKWIANTNIKELLEDVSWEQATQKIEPLNTIAALTFHINYYIAGVLNVFEGGGLEIRDKYSFDLPPINSQKDWNNLCKNLFSKAEKFAHHVEKMTNEQLAQTFVDEKYGSCRRNIEAIIEHSYYHMGQISLLKKMILYNGTSNA